MKYYIPTTTLNFNNILSTESVSSKIIYERRGFGYSRWFSVEENNWNSAILLYDKLSSFSRPASDMEDHAMLIEISCDDEFTKLSDGVYYTNKTIYLNPWQTRFIFFSEKVKRTVLSLSDSSLETKTVRLYQNKMIVLDPSTIDNGYPEVPKMDVNPLSDIESNIKEDYIINKMKGLLYGYYIGTNLSTTPQQVQKLNTLREINNIFSSVISSDDKIPTHVQEERLDTLFTQLEYQQPIYNDIKNAIESADVLEKVDVLNIVVGVLIKKREVIPCFNRAALINALQNDPTNNTSLNWINREIEKVNAEIYSNQISLDPEDAEIIVSSKGKLIAANGLKDELMKKLFTSWINNVLCSRSFHGKINSIKESLSDEITKDAKDVIGTDWNDSQIRIYLNQLRRHVRGEEFGQTWDNGVLSSIAAVLVKGNDWEQLLHFMQSKGMSDYRIAYAFYGVLNGFANLTRDFTDHLLTKESHYLSSVYREFYGQLHQRRIPKDEKTPKPEPTWRTEIISFAESDIKRNKAKLLNSLKEALDRRSNNQDISAFLSELKSYPGWGGESGPSEPWKRMQKHFLPDYYSHNCKPTKEKKSIQPELFDGVKDGIQYAEESVKGFSSDNKTDKNENQKHDSSKTINKVTSAYREGKSILDDTSWIKECASFIDTSDAKQQFIDDMEWFVGNHSKTYNDKKKGPQNGRYFGHDRSNVRVKDRLRGYLENRGKGKTEWLAEIYAKIPVAKIIDYISELYGC